MTKDYSKGFFTKCAEYGLPYDAAVSLYKCALNDDFRYALRDQALNFARNNEYIGDVTEYLGDEGYKDRMGTKFSRFFDWRGSGARNRRERELYIKSLQDAGKKWYQAQLRTAGTPEDRMALKQRYDQYMAKLEAGMAANEHRNGLSNEERDLAAFGGTKRPETPAAGAAVQPAKPRDMYEDLLDGKLALQSFYRHAFDADTGEFYRTDGRPLDPNAALWNKRMQRSRQQVANYTPPPAPAQPAAKPWDKPYQAPEQIGDFK